MYLRLLIPTRWSFLWTTVHIFIWISACFYVSITTVKIFQCTPVRKAWAKNIHGHCIDVAILLCVGGMFNTISDLFILLIPVKACWNLQMSLRKKVGRLRCLYYWGDVSESLQVSQLIKSRER